MKCILMMIATIALCNMEVSGQKVRVMFYNAENFFDTRDDSLTNDNEFLPDSARYWTYERFWRKAVRLYQVISAVDQWDMPAIVGLCEVENRDVLEKLVYDTPLEKYDYRIIHRDSPDPRGIDVALLYRSDVFTPSSSVWLHVDPDGHSQTREILLVSGKLWDKPVSIFVNHWPSRSGGELSSEPRRMAAAAVVKHAVDSLLQLDPHANIIIMGDFNDEPRDKSLQILTNPSASTKKICNLSPQMGAVNDMGTIKHRGAWSIFDQVLASEDLLTGQNGLIVQDGTMKIFTAPFLIEPDPGYPGYRPFRTYLGPNYHNGFSDHLPVSVVVEVSSQ